MSGEGPKIYPYPVLERILTADIESIKNLERINELFRLAREEIAKVNGKETGEEFQTEHYEMASLNGAPRRTIHILSYNGTPVLNVIGYRTENERRHILSGLLGEVSERNREYLERRVKETFQYLFKD